MLWMNVLLLVWGCGEKQSSDDDSVDTTLYCNGDPDGLLIIDDGDCDGVITADDCDDSDSSSTIVANDGDCDGVPTAEDCDDSNPQSISTESIRKLKPTISK